MIIEVDPVAYVTLDGSGNGQVSLGPPSGTKWAPRLATLATSTSTKTPQGFLYRGSPSGPIQLIDQTFTGNAASSQKVAGVIYYPGQLIWAVWKGGDPGAVATLQVYGQQGLKSDPFEPALVGEGFAPNARSITLPTGAGAGTARIVIGPDLPVPLNTYDFTATMPSGTGPFNAVAAIIYYIGTAGDSYQFMAVVRNSPTTAASIFTGSVSGGSMVEVVAGVPQGFMTLFGRSIYTFGTQNITANSGLNIVAGATFFIDTRSQGRGLIDTVTSGSAGSAIGTTEAVAMTSNSVTLRNGRAFKAVYGSPLFGSVANQLIVTLRRNSLAGATLIQRRSPVLPVSSATSVYYEWELKFINNSGSDITDTFVLTHIASAGTVTQDGGGSQNLRMLEIWDIGAATDFSAYISL